MLVQAVKTNCCHLLKDIDDCYGVIHKPNLFDVEESFITVPAEKSSVHYCAECYNRNVVDACNATVKRKNNEDKWQAKNKELKYVFKRHLFSIKELAAITGK